MKYSIIIPVYNAEATLRRCLDSLVSQQFSDHELLLINDGSTDGSDCICQEYADTYPQIRYFPKENGGVSSARNLGLAQARGDYVLFVDSDDYVAEDYFAVISHAIARGTPDLLLFGWRSFGGAAAERNTGTFYENTETEIADRISAALRQYLFSSLWSKVFRRRIIEENGLCFGESLAIGEDQAFIFSYAMHIRSIASIPDTLYHVDVSGEGSLSRKRRDYLTEQLIEVNRRMADALRSTEHSPQARMIYEAALAWVSYRSAYSCCKELLKYDYTAQQRRREISKICSLYRDEKIHPRDWKCCVIALPVRLGWSGAVDCLIRHKGQ